jgi:outer membrane lipoprotein SlyB
MKFIIGFIAGLAVGGFWVSNSTEEQRRRARSAAANAGRRITGSRIGQTIDENASKVAATAGDRFVDAVDSTGDALADAIGGSDAHATN